MGNKEKDVLTRSVKWDWGLVEQKGGLISKGGSVHLPRGGEGEAMRTRCKRERGGNAFVEMREEGNRGEPLEALPGEPRCCCQNLWKSSKKEEG